jgi:hypothetical protein
MIECPAPLVIRIAQIKSRVRSQEKLIPQRLVTLTVSDHLGQMEPSDTSGENVKYDKRL